MARRINPIRLNNEVGLLLSTVTQFGVTVERAAEMLATTGVEVTAAALAKATERTAA